MVHTFLHLSVYGVSKFGLLHELLVFHKFQHIVNARLFHNFKFQETGLEVSYSFLDIRPTHATSPSHPHGNFCKWGVPLLISCWDAYSDIGPWVGPLRCLLSFCSFGEISPIFSSRPALDKQAGLSKYRRVPSQPNVLLSESVIHRVVVVPMSHSRCWFRP